MVSEQPSQKSLRLTAMDSNGDIKVYLVMGRPDDVKLLNNYLNARIEIEKTKNPTNLNSSSNNLSIDDKDLDKINDVVDDDDDDEDIDESIEDNVNEKLANDDKDEPSPKKPLLDS